MAAFSYLSKSAFDGYARALFDILAGNMTLIAPTGNSLEEDYRSWYGAVSEGLQAETRQIILITREDRLIGYFQYYTNTDTFMMEEIQLLPACQQHGVFRELYGYILPRIPPEVRYVEAYAHKSNDKSNGILERLGLKVVGMNKSGNSFHYRGDYRDLLRWYDEGARG